MKNNFLNKPVANIYLKQSHNSEVVSQILYGEKFKILLKRKKYIKIKTHYDNYIGYIKKDDQVFFANNITNRQTILTDIGNIAVTLINYPNIGINSL